MMIRKPAILIAVALITAVVAVIPSSVQAQGWQGFAVSDAPSVVGAGNSESWGLGITEDLGGSGVDIWNNNHGKLSEAIVDYGTLGQSSQTSIDAGDPTTNGPDSHGVSWSDIDGDGDEDLFEVNGRNNNNRLFRNDNGSLTFVPAGNLTDFNGRGRQGLFFDFDGDSDMDVLVPNLDRRLIDGVFAPSELFVNNGNGTAWTKVPDPGQVITDGSIRIAQETSTGPTTPQIVVTHASFAINIDSVATRTATLQVASNPATRRNGLSHVREVIVGDFDGDLHPEMLVTRGNESVNPGAWPLTIFDIVEGASPRSASLPVDGLVDNCRSAAAADFDNDGDLDILAGCAQKQEGQTRNIVLLNDGIGNFSIAGTDVMPATGAETAGAIVVADLNNDGWMDAFVANGYDFDQAVDHVYMNRGGTPSHWLQIDLVGSNADAMGAQVFVGTDKWQVRETGHRNHRSQDAKTLHFGLGAENAIAPIEIMWPDGIFQTCTISGIDRRVTITKGSPSCTGQTKAGLLAALADDPDTGPPPPPPEFCQNRIVTVSLSKGQSPTNGDDVILGTPGPDTINALGGNDIVCGLGGADVINGGDGNDRILADRGDDRVDGGKGRDVIQGGAGNDVIDGGLGIDRISGNAGHDILRAGNGRDQVSGHSGRDQLFGGGGNDRLKGGNGNDSANGGIGTDTCTTIETKLRCEL